MRPTRVVRLLAEGTVEAAVLDLQRKKTEGGDAPEATGTAEVEPGALLALYQQLK